MSELVTASICFEKEVLFLTDTYRAELLRQNGKITTRSALVNTALLYYLAHVREVGGDSGRQIDPALAVGEGKESEK